MSQDVVNYQAQMAAAAAAYAASEPASGNFLSTKGGILAMGDQAMLGNQVCAVILDYVRENTYYEGDYNPDHSAAPVCYAFGREEGDMAPHISMRDAPEYFAPQAVECKGCAFNEWGSADTGKGKACQNRRRLALLPAGYYMPIPRSRDFELHLFDDPNHFKGADMAFLKLPVTSVRGWASYVKELSEAHRRPPYGVITRIYCEPDPKFQYQVKFEFVDLLPDNFLPAIFSRHDQAARQIVTGYKAPDAD